MVCSGENAKASGCAWPEAGDHFVLTFEGTDLPEAIILRRAWGANAFLASMISSMFAICARFLSPLQGAIPVNPFAGREAPAHDDARGQGFAG